MGVNIIMQKAEKSMFQFVADAIYTCIWVSALMAATAFVTYLVAEHEFKIDAVRSGNAVWVVNTEGDVSFRWKNR